MDSFIILSIVSIILSFILVWQIQSRFGKEKKYICFVRLMLAVPVWSVFALFEYIFDEKYKVIFSQLAYIGIVSVPVLWFLFSLEYSDLLTDISDKRIALFWIVPAIILIVVFTNGLHGLYWSKIYPESVVGKYIIYKYERGPFFYVNTAYAYIMFVSGFVFFFKKLLKTKTLRDFFLLILGILTPFISNFLYMARITQYDYAPAALSFACFCFAWAIVGGFFDRKMAIAEAIHTNMEEGIILIDEDYRILSINPYAMQIAGTEKINGGLKAEKVISFWDTIKGKLRENANEYFEIEANLCFYGVHLYSIHKESRLTGWIMSLMDITYKKQVEKELEERKNAAEAANIAKSNFVASMSHEIRTPLNGIIGFIDVFSKTRLDKEQQDYLYEIKNASDNLLYMVNNVLDFSKIEAAKMEIENICFNLHQVIEDVASLFTPKAHSKGLLVHSWIKAGVPEEVYGDPGRLRQVLNNLVGNAVKFTQRGHVTVSVEYKGERENKTLLEFEVSDTGIGITPDAMKKIFDPFTQADGSTTRKYGGTGLGLSISKQIIELMGGKINVESREEEGSRFYFTLEMGKGVSRDIDKAATGLNCLIVDNDDTSREICRDYLQQAGANVCEAACLSDVSLAASELNKPYDLAIMDTKALLDYEKNKDEKLKGSTIFVAVSNFNRENTKGIEIPSLCGFIAKPLKKKELIGIVKGLENKPAPDCQNGADIKNEKPAKDLPEILLVEDMEANRKLATIILSKAGYACDSAVNGEEAVNLCAKKKYGLIFMDCQMPVMDGFEAAGLIKKSGLNVQTPIIAMTANAMSGDREKCIEAGMDDYITKPIVINKLEAVIEKWAS